MRDKTSWKCFKCGSDNHVMERYLFSDYAALKAAVSSLLDAPIRQQAKEIMKLAKVYDNCKFAEDLTRQVNDRSK